VVKGNCVNDPYNREPQKPRPILDWISFPGWF